MIDPTEVERLRQWLEWFRTQGRIQSYANIQEDPDNPGCLIADIQRSAPEQVSFSVDIPDSPLLAGLVADGKPD
jgi:hypothetical protein